MRAMPGDTFITTTHVWKEDRMYRISETLVDLG